MRRTNIFEWLFHPGNSFFVISTVLGAAYAVLPLYLSLLLGNGQEFALLSGITCVGLAAMAVGSRISLLDQRFSSCAVRFYIPSLPFNLLIWVAFIVFIVVTFSTAPSIPLVSAFEGTSSDELSLERGAFLKGREGIAIVLLYATSILTSTVIPYSIVLLFHLRSRLRYVAALVFLLFCLSFLQKSLFLRLIFPVLTYFAIFRKLRGVSATVVLLATVTLLIGLVLISRHGQSGLDVTFGLTEYFSAGYIPSSPLDYFFWRIFSVPVFTASDTLIVHSELFRGEPLMGATSNFISSIWAIERINLERHVFEHQFGSWNEIANANAVYFVDGFVNFGWIGVVFFGLLVGLIFRWFRLSRDVAFQSLWSVFALNIFSAPLIGTLLSNGFALILLHALFIRVGRR